LVAPHDLELFQVFQRAEGQAAKRKRTKWSAPPVNVPSEIELNVNGDASAAVDSLLEQITNMGGSTKPVNFHLTFDGITPTEPRCSLAGVLVDEKVEISAVSCANPADIGRAFMEASFRSAAVPLRSVSFVVTKKSAVKSVDAITKLAQAAMWVDSEHGQPIIFVTLGIVKSSKSSTLNLGDVSTETLTNLAKAVNAATKLPGFKSIIVEVLDSESLFHSKLVKQTQPQDSDSDDEIVRPATPENMIVAGDSL